MNKFTLLLLSSLLVGNASAANLSIDPASSTVNWEATKIGGKHTGEVKLKSGKISFDKKNGVTGGNFEFDMTKISNSDITDKIYNDKLINHLKSGDFFSSEIYPVSKFKITQVKALKNDKDGNTHTITGNLTIKNITKPVSFPAKIETDGKKFAATGRVSIDRTKYDIRYRSKNFFKDLGDKVIDDEFRINLDLHSPNT